jgi:cell division protein FtsL
MKNKIPLILLILILISATLACRLPTFRRPESTAEVVTEDVVDEETPEEEEMEDIPPEEAESSDATRVYSDNGVEITLPASYELGDAEKDLEILVEALKTMSEEDSENIQELYANNKDNVILWAYDTNSPSLHQTSLLVMKNEEFAGMSLTIISTFAKVLLGSEVDTIQHERLTLGDRDVLRFLTTAENAGVETSQAVYLFNEADKLWLIGFFTNTEQFEDRLPSFDNAVASFTVLSVD